MLKKGARLGILCQVFVTPRVQGGKRKSLNTVKLSSHLELAIPRFSIL